MNSGKAMHGGAMRGMAMLGKAMILVWHGKALRSMAWLGVARQGEDFSQAGRGAAGHCKTIKGKGSLI